MFRGTRASSDLNQIPYRSVAGREARHGRAGFGCRSVDRDTTDRQCAMDCDRTLRVHCNAGWPGFAIDRLGGAGNERTASHRTASLRSGIQRGSGRPCLGRLSARTGRRSCRPQACSCRRHLLLRSFYARNGLCRQSARTPDLPVSHGVRTRRRNAELHQPRIGICSENAPCCRGQPALGGLSARRRGRRTPGIVDHPGLWVAIYFPRGRRSTDRFVDDPCDGAS